MSYLRYCVVGKDSEFSWAPVDLGEEGFILCDGLYDLHDTPMESEMCLLAMPKVFAEYLQSGGYGEYWNPVTRLLVEYQPGEEGFEPYEKPKITARKPKITARHEDDFSKNNPLDLNSATEGVGLNRPAVLFSDDEMFWDLAHDYMRDFDHDQHRLFKIVEITWDEGQEFYER